MAEPKVPKGEHPARILFWDIDRSSMSIGPDDRIEQAFGFKPRRFVDPKVLSTTFEKFHRLTPIVRKDDLGEFQDEVYRTHPSIDVEVYDSISEMVVKDRLQIRKEKNGAKISLPDRSDVTDRAEDLIMKQCATDTSFIAMAHIKSEKDEELGMIKYLPVLPGRLAQEVGRRFDCIFYARVITKGKAQNEFVWQGIMDERYNAKCRVPSVVELMQSNGGTMPQDYGLLFNKARESGFVHLKILILGDSGAGKTHSLRTLTGVTFPDRNK